METKPAGFSRHPLLRRKSNASCGINTTMNTYADVVTGEMAEASGKISF